MDWQSSNGGVYPSNMTGMKPESVLPYNDYYRSGTGAGGEVTGSYNNHRGTDHAAIQHVPETNANYQPNGGGGYYSDEVYPSYFEYPPYAPCDGGPGPWSFNYCYGFFGEAPCPYANVIDMEDFMNNEKRKEKSRDAARTRRSRETEIFTDLGEALPLAKEEVDQLDKASVMRLAIAYLKVRDMVDIVSIKGNTQEEEDVKPSSEALLCNEADQLLMKALDGFLMVLSEDGDITYVSENITELLGLHQIDILSQPIWDYAHQCDHEELKNVLSQKRVTKRDEEGSKSYDMFLRLKCTLTSRGRSVNIKSASFKVIHLMGHIVVNDETNKKLFVAIGRPIPHPSNIEVPLGSNMFLTKHSLDMKFSYVDEKLTSMLKHQASVLIGKSLFDYHHGGDSEHLSAAFKCLLSKGQMETKEYRFLCSGGGYAWIVTQATIVYDKQKPQSIVCVNYMISGIENEYEVYSIAQLEARPSLTKEASSGGSEHKQHQPLLIPVRKEQQDRQCQKKNNIYVTEQKVQKPTRSVRIVEPSKTTRVENSAATPVPVANSVNRPRSVTDALFAAAPEVAGTTPLVAADQKNLLSDDMNKGFLQFTEVDPELTMLKEEVDDLSHLAPTPGDACIPLDESTSFLASYEELNDLIDNYIYGDGVTGFDAVTVADIPIGSSTQQHHNYNQADTFFAEPKRRANNDDEMTVSCASLSHKPLLKDAIISENVFAAAGLTVITNNKGLEDEDFNMLIDSETVVNEKKMDPFITYRDESSDTSVATSHLLSPDDCSVQSPDGSLPSSLCSPTESYADEDLAFMTSISMEDEMDMSMRAPYISMSEADDLPLLISDDLMWGALPCDAPKFVQEPKLNVVLDVSTLQVMCGKTELAKGGDYLLPNQSMHTSSSPASLLATNVCDKVSPLTLQMISNDGCKRSKSGLLFAEDGENMKTMSSANLLLQQFGGEGIVTGLQVNGSGNCSSSEDTNHSDAIEPMFEESMVKNCSSWSFTEFMAMDSGVDGQLYSSDCNSPFTSTSSMDSMGSPVEKEQHHLETDSNRKLRNVCNKRPLSSSPSSARMSLKEMLCGGDSIVSANSRMDTLSMSQAKRIKCETDTSNRSVVLNTLTNASPQLLQQLMAPNKSQSLKVKVASSASNRKDLASTVLKAAKIGSCKSNDDTNQGFVAQTESTSNQQQAPAPSNSVLMNLLSPLHIEAPPNIINDAMFNSGISYDSPGNSPNLLRANPLIGGDQQMTPNTTIDESMLLW